MHESGIGPYGWRNCAYRKRNATLRPMWQPALADPIARGGDIGRLVIRGARLIRARNHTRRVAIVLRCAPGLGTSTRRRCRSGDASAPTAVIPAALAATVAITQQSKR